MTDITQSQARIMLREMELNPDDRAALIDRMHGRHQQVLNDKRLLEKIAFSDAIAADERANSEHQAIIDRAIAGTSQ